MRWDERKLNKFIEDRIQENLNLEYKGSKALDKSQGKKKEISKDVSAIANSAGGVIIYGIGEYDEKESRHLPKEIEPINRVEFSKEWLEQVINTNIFPRIENITIIPVQLGTDLNHVSYVIEIPQSKTAHQANDFRYYKRYNFESVPMYDYELRDIMNRNCHPNLTINLIHEILYIEKYDRFPTTKYSLPGFEHALEEKKEYWEHYNLTIQISNIGNVLAKHVKIEIKVPSSILKKDEYEYLPTAIIDTIEYKLFNIDNTIQDIVHTEYVHMGNSKYTYGPKRYDPILPNLNFGYNIKLREIKELPEIKVYWKIYADEASPKEGETESVIKKVIKK